MTFYDIYGMTQNVIKYSNMDIKSTISNRTFDVKHLKLQLILILTKKGKIILTWGTSVRKCNYVGQKYKISNFPFIILYDSFVNLK